MSDVRKLVLSNLSERQFQEAVLELARLFGWRQYHTFNSRRSEAGFPDLVLARAGRLVMAELKTTTGRVSRAQLAWLSDLEECPGVEVHVWRPDNLSEIERTLAGRDVSTGEYEGASPQVRDTPPDPTTGGPRTGRDERAIESLVASCSYDDIHETRRAMLRAAAGDAKAVKALGSSAVAQGSASLLRLVERSTGASDYRPVLELLGEAEIRWLERRNLTTTRHRVRTRRGRSA